MIILFFCVKINKDIEQRKKYAFYQSSPFNTYANNGEL